MLPGLAAVVAAVETCTGSGIRGRVRLTGTGVNHVGIARINRDCTDRIRGKASRYKFPLRTAGEGAGGAPYAAASGSNLETAVVVVLVAGLFGFGDTAAGINRERGDAAGGNVGEVRAARRHWINCGNRTD